MDDNVETILKERYYQPGETSWDQLAARVGNYIGNTTEEKHKFTELIKGKYIIPASPFLMNAGTETPQLFSCFVLPIEDDISSIFKFYADAAKVFKYSGGVGANWSALRPKGAPLSGGGYTSGVLSFMRIYNELIETVSQGGKKKGASICLLNIDHPECKDFIKSKLIDGEFKNFNISPVITDAFMELVILEDPEAMDLFNLIVDCTYASSEPGMLFIDTINKNNSTPGLGSYSAVNPCGERPLMPYESCCLTALVLPKFIVGGKLDYNLLESVTRSAIRFLDNSMDKNFYPIPEIKEATLATRRLGLYITGFADVLIMLGIRYGSTECINFQNSMWKFINEIAWDESQALGLEKGKFPAYICSDARLVPNNARNAAVTCLAPSGTTSIFAGVNWGIEPIYSFAQMRLEGAGQGFQVFYLFEEMLDRFYPEQKQEIISHCAKHGTIQNIPYISADIKKVFVTAHDLNYRQHIEVQAAFQALCNDGSISKTINLPSSTTRNDIKEAYIYAWRLGCKGVTFYREGTRRGVYQLTAKPDPSNVVEISNPVEYKLVTANGRIVPKTPRVMNATVVKCKTGCGKLYVIPAEANGDMHSLFLINKGGCSAMTQTVAELIGSMRRFGIPRWELTRICSGIRCPACKGKAGVSGRSCADIIANVILELYPDEEMPPKIDIIASDSIDIIEGDSPDDIIDKFPRCPDCRAPLSMIEGCVTCMSCGYSRCS